MIITYNYFILKGVDPADDNGGQTGHHPDRQQLKVAFEWWVVFPTGR